MYNLRKNRFFPLIVAAITLGLIIILFNIVTKVFIFNVVKTPSNVSTTTTTLEYTFNKELEDVKKESVVVATNDSIGFITKTDGKKLVIYLQEPPNPYSDLRVELNNIQSKSGSVISKAYNYKIDYAPASKQSKEEIQAATDRSDSFEKNYPLIKKLPLISKNWQILAEFPDSNTYKMPITIECLTVLPMPTTLQGDLIPETANVPAVNDYKAEIRVCRDEATKQLKELGFNTEYYTLYCSEPYLLKEYGCDSKPVSN